MQVDDDSIKPSFGYITKIALCHLLIACFIDDDSKNCLNVEWQQIWAWQSKWLTQKMVGK